VLSVVAVLSILALSQLDQLASVAALRLAVFFVAIGFAAQFLSYNTGRAIAGSISLIPYAAAVIVAPHLLTVVAVVLSELAAQVFHRRPLIKSTFNVVQVALSFSLAVLAYLQVGGYSFLELKGAGFLQSLRALFVPCLILVAVVNLVNSFSVSAAVAVSTRQPLLGTWARMGTGTAKSFAIVVLLSFYLVWLGVNLGLVGTLGLVFPMILARQLIRTTAELTNFTEELLDLMVAAIEARDPYTSGHSKRVAKGSTIIAKALGLRPHEVERVAVAALLHDVGKIDERFAPILAKEGRLTPEEWAIMKTHPVRSAELVGKVSSLRDIVGPVRHHHENWDGSGYPDGLKGEEIPLAARIIMFADTLDAITTDRPYRRALGLEDARAEFLRFRGRQFDPAICDRILAPDVWKELYQGVVATNRGSKEYANSPETELLHFKT
jgi:putative nucleotidyltransferase with HDIG domain